MAVYEQLLRSLEQWGLLDFVLPVLLIFAVSFGLLQRMKIFGAGADAARKPNKQVNMVLSLGIALAAVIPHLTGQGPDVIVMIAQVLPNSIVIVFGLFLSLLMMSLVTDKRLGKENVIAGILAIIAFAALLFVILQAGGFITLPFLNFLLEPNTLALLVIILVFGLIVYYVQYEKPADDKKIKIDDVKNIFERLFG